MPTSSISSSNSSVSKNFLKGFTILGSFVALVGVFVVVSVLNQTNVAPTNTNAAASTLVVCPSDYSSTDCTKNASGTAKYVGGDGLRLAITDAASGDTVYIHNGTYKNTGTSSPSTCATCKAAYLVENKNLTIKGESKDGVVLDGSLSSVSSGDLKLGVVTSGNSVVNVSSLTIKNYVASGTQTGAGAVATDSSSLTIDSSSLVSNDRGAYIKNEGKINITNSNILNNVTYGFSSSIDSNDNSAITSINNTISGNSIGILIVKGKATIKNTKFENNNGTNGSPNKVAIYCSGTGTIDNQGSTGNTFSNNTGGNFVSANSACPGTTEDTLKATTPPSQLQSITVCPDAVGEGCTAGYVGADGLQRAIADIASGGTITVKNGTYKNTTATDVQFQNTSGTRKVAYLLNKDITINGESKDGVILDGSSSPSDASGVRGLVSNGSAKVNISNLTITKYSWSGFTSADTSTMNVTNSNSSSNVYYGFLSFDTSTMNVTNSSLDNNLHGFQLGELSTVSINNSIITNNSNGISVYGNSKLTIKNSQIKDNTSNRFGSGNSPYNRTGIVCGWQGTTNGSNLQITPDSTGNTFSNNLGGDYVSVNEGCKGTTIDTLKATTPPSQLSAITVCAPESDKTGCTAGYVGTSAEDAAAKLQIAIRDIASGGTITVKNGTYKNTTATDVQFQGISVSKVAYLLNKDITINGESKDGVILDGSSLSNSTAGILTNGSAKVNISNLTVTKYSWSGFTSADTSTMNVMNSNSSKNFYFGFGSLNNSHMIVKNSISQSNAYITNGDQARAGVDVYNSSVMEVYDSIIDDNGRGVQMGFGSGSDAPKLTIKNTQIINTGKSHMDYAVGFGIVCDSLSAVITPESTGNTFSNNKAGDYHSDGGCVGTTIDTLKAGSTTTGYAVGGKVVDQNGAALKNVEVKLQYATNSNASTVTGSDGKYYFDPNIGLKTGDTYSVTLPDSGIVVHAGLNTDTGNLSYTYRQTDKRDTKATDTNFVQQLAGTNDCASDHGGQYRCNFTVTVNYPTCTSLKINDQTGSGTAPIIISPGSSATFKLNFTNITNQTGVVNFYNYANGTVGDLIKSGTATTVNGSTSYTYDQLLSFVGSSNVNKVVQVNGTLNPFVNYDSKCVVWMKLGLASAGSTCIVTGCNNEVCSDSAKTTTCEYKDIYACYSSAECKVQADNKCGWTQTSTLLQCLGAAQVTPTYSLTIPAQTNNTAANRLTLKQGESVSIEYTKSSAFTVDAKLGIYNNDNNFANSTNPQPVKYNGTNVIHTMQKASNTKYTKILRFEDVCVADQNWNNQKVVNVQVNGFEGNTTTITSVRWLKCDYGTPTKVNGVCPAPKVTGNCGTDVTMTCSSGTPNVSTQKATGDYKCLGTNGGTDATCNYTCTNTVLPACSRSCENDTQCGTGKKCVEVIDSACNPNLSGAKQVCVANDTVVKPVCTRTCENDTQCQSGYQCQEQDSSNCDSTNGKKQACIFVGNSSQSSNASSNNSSTAVTKCSRYDLNSDGKIDIFGDFTLFLNNLIKRNTLVDFNTDTETDIKDFVLFKLALYKYIDTKSCNL